MWKRRVSVALMLVCYLVLVSSSVQAATITACAFDKDWYYPGQTGYVAVTVYNDEESTIRVDKLSATIDYYYTDDNVYLQTFFNYPDPPKEILQGESDTFNIDFSLPTNVAPGYTTLYVKAETEIWNDDSERWQGSDHPTYYPTLYIESPYKDQLETQETANQQLETTNQQITGQLQEQQVLNQHITNMMYVLGATTVGFAAVIGILLLLLRKARILAQPAA